MGKINLPKAVAPLVAKGAQVAYIPPEDAPCMFTFSDYTRMKQGDVPGLSANDLKIGRLELACVPATLEKAKAAIAKEQQDAAKAAKK
jgi:hypothetical protein